MKRLFISACLAFACTSALADCNATSCTAIFVDRLYVDDSGLIYIHTSGSEANLTCNAPNNYLAISPTNAGKKDMMAMLLSSQVSNKKVNIRLKDGVTNCEVAYIYINR